MESATDLGIDKLRRFDALLSSTGILKLTEARPRYSCLPGRLLRRGKITTEADHYSAANSAYKASI